MLNIRTLYQGDIPIPDHETVGGKNHLNLKYSRKKKGLQKQ